MIRASAKNFIRVAAVVDPGDYGAIVEEVKVHDGALSLKMRFRLAQKAFAHTAEYDRSIATYLADKSFAAVDGCYQG
jgi:phosphoribosylaminoimidazolecarboxamide formyltransferase/IMP cyclohydrolase